MHGHTSDGYFGDQVQSVDFIHPGIVQYPSLDYRLGPGENFLGGLKDKDYRARKRGAARRQNFIQGNADSRVPSVTAGMHHIGVARCKRHTELLG